MSTLTPSQTLSDHPIFSPTCPMDHLTISQYRGKSADTTYPWRCIMAYSKDSKSAAVRARLDHPVIDGDGLGWSQCRSFSTTYGRWVGHRRWSASSSRLER